MGVVTRGRILRRDDTATGSDPVRILRAGASEAQRTRMLSEEATAHRNADRIVNDALTKARALIEDAREEAARTAKETLAHAAETEQARLAAAWLALRSAEENRAARDLEHAIQLARLLAERLIGYAVDANENVVAALAREALAEARGSRSVVLEAHPLDAASLRATLAERGLGALQGVAIEIKDSDALARGSLCVHTDLGTLDARLHPRLERLAAALRDALKSA